MNWICRTLGWENFIFKVKTWSYIGIWWHFLCYRIMLDFQNLGVKKKKIKHQKSELYKHLVVICYYKIMIGLVEPWGKKIWFLDAKIKNVEGFHGNFDVTKSWFGSTKPLVWDFLIFKCKCWNYKGIWCFFFVL